MIITVLIPLVLMLVIKRKTGNQARVTAIYFLLFGPVGILTFMFFHLFENSYHAIEHAMAGDFKYDFHFYSLMLMGAVLACIAGFLTRACWKKCMGQLYKKPLHFLIHVSCSIDMLTLVSHKRDKQCACFLLHYIPAGGIFCKKKSKTGKYGCAKEKYNRAPGIGQNLKYNLFSLFSTRKSSCIE